MPNVNVTANWITHALDRIDKTGPVVRASVINRKGSAPRDVGAMMLIDQRDIWQTIGGGTLEFDVMRQARQMINDTPQKWQRRVIKAALGPDMGQCCGGFVEILLEVFGDFERDTLSQLAALAVENERLVMLAHPLVAGPELSKISSAEAGLVEAGFNSDKTLFIAPISTVTRVVFLYGAGHIGRALVGHLAALELDVHWIDIGPTRFPMQIPSGVRRVIASDPALIAGHAPPDAIHLVITHNHALDEAICYSVLKNDHFARLGLIGSATKRARFQSRLTKAGITPDKIKRLACPIGLPEIAGKQPVRIALSIAAEVAIWQQELAERQPQATRDIALTTR
ncbi:xanthine dehydrogenase accessory protein XdhC [Alphaproteobacteria bacterium]|jgi:xanthine dehydrogenase accessory factor|nr:xanthine dehydrogenase accessory protein XdhC [Alphaproteobacteria bacterium]